MKSFRVGVLYAKKSQSNIEEMYHNQLEDCHLPFHDLVQSLGRVVALRNWSNYNGGLDSEAQSDGVFSVYQKWNEFEFMFHICPFIPYDENSYQHVFLPSPPLSNLSSSLKSSASFFLWLDGNQAKRRFHLESDNTLIVFFEPGAHLDLASLRSPHHLTILGFQAVDEYQDVTQSVDKSAEERPTKFKFRVCGAHRQDLPEYGPVMNFIEPFSLDNEFADFFYAKCE